jgi:hypothetical protein
VALHARFDSDGNGARQDLVVLRADLMAARAALAADRTGPQTSPTVHQAASAELLHCLQAYVAALTERRLPVPPALRDELRLRQGLYSPER